MTINDVPDLALAQDAWLPILQGQPLSPALGTISAGPLANGQYTVAISGGEGMDEVDVWPLNGVVLEVGDIVWVLFASAAPESGVILGRQKPMAFVPWAVFPPASATATGVAGQAASDGSLVLRLCGGEHVEACGAVELVK